MGGGKIWHKVKRGKRMGSINQEHLNILNQVAYYSSKKLRVNQDDLTSYLSNKLPNIFRNFEPDLNKDFNKFLTISLRFYSLNFLRDCSWATKVSARELKLYTKILKWKSFKVASRRLGVSIKELKEIHKKVLSNRNQFHVPLSKVSYQISYDSVDNNSYVNFVNSIGGIENAKKYEVDILQKMYQQYVLSS